MWFRKSVEADAIILASPTHFATVTVEMKSYMDRVGWMVHSKGLLKHKLGASIASCQGDGAVSTITTV